MTLIRNLVFLLLMINFSVYATESGERKGKHRRPDKDKMFERLLSMKQIKLLEILELEEGDSEKFLVKYRQLETEFHNLNKKTDQLADELTKMIRSNESQDKIQAKLKTFLAAQEEMLNFNTKRLEEIRKILSPENFAKYVVFEHKFMEHIQHAIRKRMKDRRGEPDGPPPGGPGF